MKNKILYISNAFIIALIIMPVICRSDIPRILSFQGVLRDSYGNVKPDGHYYLNLRLYDAVDATTPLWQAMHQDVETRNGIFNTKIGAPPEPPLPEFDKPYWLGLQVEMEEEMEPRIQFLAAPYSLNSHKADVADNVSNNVLPIGTILPFAGKKEKIPAGWLYCDGRALIPGEYPELFAVLGTSWGDGSEDTNPYTEFNLPDFRGLFLRGLSDSSDVDPDAAARQPLKPGGNGGDSIGSYQDDSGNFLDNNDQGLNNSAAFNPKLVTLPSPGSDQSQSAYSTIGGHEVRPANAGVYYIIKVR